MDEILVVCPRCQRCAHVVRRDAGGTGLFDPRRAICARCGYLQEWQGREIRRAWQAQPALDDFFHLSLWLQTECVSNTLWAYNLRHLALIAAYVAAPLRERRQDPTFGWTNRSLASRLPRWVGLAKHREPVLRAITRLKARAQECA